ncbi:MerR family transcriptional regulator [Chloroflexota bacterium]
MCAAIKKVEESAPMLKERRPVYAISVAAEILGVHDRTLRIYEQQGLLVPARRRRWRFYSEEDLSWIRVIRYLLHEKGLNVAGLRRMLSLIPCWEVKGCPPEERELCSKPELKSSPCWLVAYHPDKKCHLCLVYRLARRHVCDEEELKQGEVYEEYGWGDKGYQK